MVQATVFLRRSMVVDRQDSERLLADALPEGIVILDDEGHLAWWNCQASRLLGLSLKADCHKAIDQVLHEPVLATLKSGNTLLLRPYLRPNLQVLLKLRSYSNEQHLLIAQDVTVTQKLESMRRDFVANVSHELRTPLTVFQGYLELLKESPELSEQQLTEIISHMDGQASRMHNLVEDLLLLSRLESVEPDLDQYQQVPVTSMLRNIHADAVSLSGSKQHHFVLDLDEDLLINGDPEELRSAFSNLIYNAVHYTPAHGTITIRCHQKDHTLFVEVEDTGIGVAQKHQSRITQRFYRVDKARSSAAGGTGLGLALVKHILMRHHGDLEIESELGKGSLFRCVFPDKM